MMTTPKTHRGQATRERIVAAAAALMFAHGVRGTSLDDVLKEAGVSKSQLYHYFRDKDDLVRAVIARQTEQVLVAQRPLLDELDGWAAVAAWFDLLVAIQSERECVGGCPLGSLASELADEDEDARRDLAQSFDLWEGYLVRGLERMRERGELAATADPTMLAEATMASIQGGLLLTQTRKTARPLRRALDAALAYLLSFRA
jgi:TetR/AcrR family transcriptional repressor of nem operon